MDLMISFHKRIEIKDDGCFEWIGGKDKNGYGLLYLDDKQVYAHRFAYQLYKGNIDYKLHIHHVCENTSCVNPDHLEAVTPEQHILQSIKHNKNKTHCKRGHIFDKNNTYYHKHGRTCRKCDKLRHK